MVKEHFFRDRILEYYSWIEVIVKNSNSFGYTDINISLESLVLKLLNLLELGDYTNCNNNKINYPTIDLFDDNQKVGIQITSECSANKIKDTLSKKTGYKIKFFFLDSSYMPNKKTYDNYNNLSSDDIWNFKKCLQVSEQKNKLEELFEFFRENIILPVNPDNLKIKSGYEIYEQQFFLNKMKEVCNRFVPTSITFKCLDHLEKNNLLILTGNPGVGKSYNSYFLTAKLMEQGYILLHSPNNDLKDIFLKYNNDDKFVLFIDDVFGSNEISFMRYLSEEEFVSLIESKNDNLKIIINSRCTIFEDVNTHFDKIQRLRLNPFVIEVDDFSCLEKARILVKHLESNLVPREKIKDLFACDIYSFDDYPTNQKIYKILFHKNYNPRAIELATSLIDEEKNFSEHLLKVLANPSKIYEHAYNTNLNDVDREILRIVYLKSRSNFEQSIYTDDIFKFGNKLSISENAIKNSLRKLENSFICQYNNSSGMNVCKFYNPGILDFCRILCDSSYDMIKYVDLVEDPSDLKNLLNNNKIEEDKKIERMYQLRYTDYDDIRKISSERIKNNEDFVEFLINDIFDKQTNYYFNMDYFCSDEFISDDKLVSKIEFSQNLDKYIYLSNGKPNNNITVRMLKLINKFPLKKKDIFTSLAGELSNEIISDVVVYIQQTDEEDDCEENFLEDEFNYSKDAVWKRFIKYITNENISILSDEMDYIFNLIDEFDSLIYSDDISTHFSQHKGKRALSDDESEAVRYLDEYNASM